MGEKANSVQDCLSDDGFFSQKNTVRVYNRMNDNILVYLHCQSKDDDLGQHVLAVGEHQEWSFNDRPRGICNNHMNATSKGAHLSEIATLHNRDA
ncbi:hypothetical protein JHK86_001743 [Glycine max]|nr:hypothetical protein JHK86_001743 [Glycine max]